MRRHQYEIITPRSNLDFVSQIICNHILHLINFPQYDIVTFKSRVQTLIHESTIFYLFLIINLSMCKNSIIYVEVTSNSAKYFPDSMLCANLEDLCIRIEMYTSFPHS